MVKTPGPCQPEFLLSLTRHCAAPCAGRQSSFIKTTCIHAGSAQQHFAVAAGHTLEHSLDSLNSCRRQPVGVTMSLNLSVTQSAQSVREVLTANKSATPI